MTLAVVLAGVVVLALNAYVLLAGADFGGGVWDLLARGPRARRQRELIAHAIGPIWEANHVWLILAIVLLFVCFPAAYSRIVIALNLPLTLVLFGIVLRGSAFAFRSYGGDRDAVQERWGRVFASASLVTPVLLGMSFGAVSNGLIPAVVTAASPFTAAYVDPWLTLFGVEVGAVALTAFAYLAAVYLTLAAGDDLELREDFRARALASGVVLLLVGAPPMLLLKPDRAIVACASIAAGVALWALWTRRYAMARIAAAAQVSFVLWGWAVAQFPFIVPPDLTIAEAAAPARTLQLVAGALALGGMILIPSLLYLYRLFARQGAPHDAAP